MQQTHKHQCDTVPIIGFWLPDGEFGCFSNWYPADFVYARKHFTSVEQYMMYQKVSMFGKHDLAEIIMQTDDPAECKKIGRTKFPEFDSKMWDKTRKQIVKRGVKAKFRQNEPLLAKLLSTRNALLAESSPYDSIWGIGVSTDNPDWQRVENWRGRNLLGRALMEVREELGRELQASGNGSVVIGEEYYSKTIPEWNMRAGDLNRIPQYHDAIHAYSDTLTDHHTRDAFYHQGTLAEWEYAMLTNLGGGLPAVGFYEMKQDVYDTARYLHLGLDNSSRLLAFCERHIPMLRAILEDAELVEWCRRGPSCLPGTKNTALDVYFHDIFPKDVRDSGVMLVNYEEIIERGDIGGWLVQPTRRQLDPLDAEHVQACISWHLARKRSFDNPLITCSVADGYLLVMLETLADKLRQNLQWG